MHRLATAPALDRDGARDLREIEAGKLENRAGHAPARDSQQDLPDLLAHILDIDVDGLRDSGRLVGSHPLDGMLGRLLADAHGLPTQRYRRVPVAGGEVMTDVVNRLLQFHDIH